MITQSRLKEVLDYNQDTGVFRWKVSRGRYSKVGVTAGSPTKAGYIYISVDGVKRGAHRLAYLYIHGYIPREVDHRNNIKHDNRIDNLRAATHSQNAANSGIYSSNTSGYKGIYFSTKVGKWHARISVDRKVLHLGFFTNILDAAAAYKVASAKYFGEFART